MIRKILLLFFIVNLFSNSSFAQDTTLTPVLIKPVKLGQFNPPPFLLQKKLNFNYKNIDPLKKDIDYVKLSIIGGLTLGVGIGVHIHQANAWWKTQSSKFRIMHDWTYARWIDKVGHFYGTNLIAHGLSAGLEYSNISLEDSYIYGALGAFAFQLYVEIEDGFGPQWGFSPGDLVFDLLGASYFVSQYYFPYLKNFQPRVSYWPSEEYLNGTHKGNVIDDYEGQKYWVSVRMKEVLPKSLSEFWPSFLMLAGGMEVRNLDGSGGGITNFYIAFDFDAEVIPLHGPFWGFIKNTLNYLHFPMPGVRLTNGAAFLAFVY